MELSSYGIVAVTQEGKSIYGEMNCNAKGVLKYTIPENIPLTYLWLVVMGAPTEHWMNSGPEEKDTQWPYRIKVTGTHIL